MADAEGETVHASCVLLGNRAVLIRGPAGSGKSSLALSLLTAAGTLIPFAHLVADDRVQLTAVHGRLLASVPASIAGLLEVRGLGIRRVPHEPEAVVGLVVDLAANDADRLPAAAAMTTTLLGVDLPRLPVAPGADPLPIVIASFSTAAHA
jgi:serine kinase of HPr protein (carbohydrate metabolism regulator)